MALFFTKKRLLFALFGLALVLRIGRYLSGDLAFDAALTGRLGFSLLEGGFPLFLYGQRFMGSLDAYLSAPLYLLAGPSALTLNFLPAFLSLASLLVLTLFLKKIHRSPGFYVGLLFLAVPPALSLYWAAEARSYYPVALFLSALLMGLTIRLGKKNKEVGAFLPFGWGLIAGLAFWTNFLTGVVIGAGVIYILISARNRIWGKPLGWFFGGTLVGAGPLLLSFFIWGRPWMGVIPPSPDNRLSVRLSDIFFNSLPIVLGITPPENQIGLSPQSFSFLVYLLLLALMVWGLAGLWIKGFRSGPREALLPVLILLLNLGASLIGGRPPDYREQDQRYLLPFYLALPFCWGYLADRLSLRRGGTLFLSLLLIGVHSAGYVTFRGGGGLGWGGGPLLGITSGFYFREEGRAKALIRSMADEGFQTLYSNNTQFGFLAGSRPLISGLVGEDDLSISARVDSSLNPGFQVPLEPNSRLLGLPCRVSRSGVLHSFSRPTGADRLLDRPRWKAVSLDGRRLDNVLNDEDLATAFNTQGDNPDGQGFILDLGREEMVDGFILISGNYQEIPAGLRIETAGADGSFHLAREVRDYIGPFYLSGPHPFLKTRYPRVECYFPLRPLRFLKLTQLGHIRKDWPVSEVLLLGPEKHSREITWPLAADLLAKAVSAHPLKKLYSDAWPSAVLFTRLVHKPALLLPNQYTDNYGSQSPSPSDPLLLDPSLGNGLLISPRETALTSRRLSLSGIGHTAIPAGNYTLFLLQGRTEGSPLTLKEISSVMNPEEASALARGLPPGKRWSSGTPQKPGLSLAIDLGEEQTIDFVTLRCPHHPADFPRGLRASYSLDGEKWEETPIQLVEPLAFTGQVLLLYRGPVQRYRLTPTVRGRFLRLSLTEADSTYWWSVESIRISRALRPGEN